jgi:hypothetical protein
MTDETDTYKGFLVRNFRQKVGDVIDECRTHSLSEDSRIHIKDTLAIEFSKALDSYREETVKEIEKKLGSLVKNGIKIGLSKSEWEGNLITFLSHLKGGDKE